MSHSVNTISFDYGTTDKQIAANKQKIEFECNEDARYNSDSRDGLDSRIKFNDRVQFDTREEAEEWLDEQTSKGFYWQGACLFKERETVKSNAKSDRLSKKVNELEIKKSQMLQALDAYVEKNSAKNRKSIYVGCPKCGSKLHKDYLWIRGYSQPCPLCETNLFSDTVKTRVAKYKSDIEAISKQIVSTRKDVEKAKQTNKFKLKWLVRYEYHC